MFGKDALVSLGLKCGSVNDEWIGTCGLCNNFLTWFGIPIGQFLIEKDYYVVVDYSKKARLFYLGPV